MLGFSPFSAGPFSASGESSALNILTGQEATASVGTVQVFGYAPFATAGPDPAVGSVGQVTVDAGSTAILSIGGATAEVGQVTVDAGVTAPVTGVSATGSVNGVTVVNVTVAAVTGQSLTGTVGSIAYIKADAVVSPTSVVGTGAVGSITAGIVTVAEATGVSGSGSVGSITMTGGATIVPDGVEGTGVMGQANVWGKIVPNTGTVWTEIQA